MTDYGSGYDGTYDNVIDVDKECVEIDDMLVVVDRYSICDSGIGLFLGLANSGW